MYCVQNRYYCHDCSKSYIDRSNSNHLRYQGHDNNVMKKPCCSCSIATPRNKICCNNHDLACCIKKLSLKSVDNLQTDLLDKQDISSRTITCNVIDIDLNNLRYKLNKFWKNLLNRKLMLQ